MKNKYLIMIIIILVLLVIIIGICLIKRRNKVEIKDIKSMYFSYSNGYMINSNVYYELNCKENKCIATIKPNQMSEENKLEVEVDKKTVHEIIKVLKENEIEKWNGFDKSNKNVLDGDSFTFQLKTNDNEIYAHGYMKWPKNYSNVRNSLDNIFMDIYNSNKNDN